MNAKQEAAIKKLEAALKACKDADVRLFGMDSELLAYDGKLVNEVRQKIGWTPDAHEIRDYTDYQYQGETVNDHGAYMYSGGW